MTEQTRRRSGCPLGDVLELLAGVSDGRVVEHHILADGRPLWDTIWDLPLDGVDAVLRQAAWTLVPDWDLCRYCAEASREVA